ncbi:MAG: TIGR04282 family arsenosugar biosynthesis glycosyltransferase [Marinosulfonomonas sp.]|nr:TIGR04282 family arsenosugar biosynthesis glycosyltransferase [Marinosulfonomonas sp.]
MVKEPRPGWVKTRLGKSIGMTSAAWWFRHQTKRLLRRVQHPGWETILAVSPDIAGMNSRIWPEHLARMPQGTGDLGARMNRIFDTLSPGPVVIIGGDIPDITSRHIAGAFRALGNHDCVFGPATDGGYWAVGLRRTGPRPYHLFDNVRWSSEFALADSIATASGQRVTLLETLRDVDTVDDL